MGLVLVVLFVFVVEAGVTVVLVDCVIAGCRHLESREDPGLFVALSLKVGGLYTMLGRYEG